MLHQRFFHCLKGKLAMLSAQGYFVAVYVGKLIYISSLLFAAQLRRARLSMMIKRCFCCNNNTNSNYFRRYIFRYIYTLNLRFSPRFLQISLFCSTWIASEHVKWCVP